MTRDEVIELAKEAGFEFPEMVRPHLIHLEMQLWRFAALVAEREREECAQVCDEAQERYGRYAKVAWCAAAIRAKKA